MAIDGSPSLIGVAVGRDVPNQALSTPTLGRALLILGCSQRKHPSPQPLSALDRYDGIFFRVLKKFLREFAYDGLDVLIISARFGLIEANTPIPDYDQRMTKQRAAQVAPNVIAELRKRLNERCYREIFVNMGREYEATVTGIERLKRAGWAAGGIGERASQLKKWLRSLMHEVHPQ